jgi:hypothetical protein
MVDPGGARVAALAGGVVATVLGAASILGCGGHSSAPTARDDAVGGESGTGVTVTGSCAGRAPGVSSVPVSGSVRGPSVDARLRERGTVTSFLGPGASATSAYSQSFDRTGSEPDGQFVVVAPADVVTASLVGWAGATAAEVGAYPRLGGFFVFEMAFPIPAGIVCSSPIGDCGPQCEGVGEAGVCMPRHPKVRYSASLEASSSDWRLRLDSVCPQPISGTLINFETHGHLTATLVNEADASESVEVNLDF